MGREVGDGAAGLGREPWTVRVAVWSARHRWVVLGAWFVFTLGLMFASVAAGGQRSQSVMDKGKTIGDSQTGWNVFNDASTAQKIDTETFYLIVSNPNGKLDTPANRQAIADMTKRLTVLTAVVDGSTGETGTVGDNFTKQSDGSWISSTTDTSTTLCTNYDTGQHDIGFQDSTGNMVSEGTFTVLP